jgi:hypothetical protein
VRAEGKVNDTDARLWHPWLRINRVLRVMLNTRWSAEAWSEVQVELRRALALRSEIRRAGWFQTEGSMKKIAATVLLAWFFAVPGGTIGPFDTLADCEGIKVAYRAGVVTARPGSEWTSNCWEAMVNR